jgi:hypothetical protein
MAVNKSAEDAADAGNTADAAHQQHRGQSDQHAAEETGPWGEFGDHFACSGLSV